MMMVSELERQLMDIKRRIDEIERPPATTLDIIDSETEERCWEALLVYFLNTNNPHGFGTDVLKAFLRSIATHEDTTLSGPFQDLDQVNILSQAHTGAGPVDILLWVEDEWYVCIEMKIGSPETGEQTVRYAEATKLGDIHTSQHDGVSEYVYLAPADAPPPTSSEFVEIAWKHVVEHLSDVIVHGYGQYPSKSTAQLGDYLDTIRRELNMGELNTISEETVLYIEYAGLFQRVIEQYEADRDKLYRALRESFFSESKCTHDEWTVTNRSDRYIKFYKPEWQNLEGGTNIEYEPHLKLNQDPPEIRLRLDIEHSDKDAVREEFRNRLDQNERQKL